jgi:hypothetical protein
MTCRGRGAGWAGMGSVAMVFSLRDFVWPRAAFSTAMWHGCVTTSRIGQQGWSERYCVDRKVISVKPAS